MKNNDQKLFTASINLTLMVSEGSINGEGIDTEEIADLNEIFSSFGINDSNIRDFVKWDLDTNLIKYLSHDVKHIEIVENSLNIVVEVKFDGPHDFDTEKDEFDDHLFDLKNGIIFGFNNESSFVDMLQEDCSVDLID